VGRRGPVRTPTRVLELHRSWRAKARADEPEPERKRPVCPRWLRDEAKRVWRELIPQLESMGTLGRCDRNALARYCQTWAKWRVAEEFLAESGDVYVRRGDSGKIEAIKEYPQASLALRLADQLLKLEREFGLTPSARAGLAKPKDNPNENRGKERFFKKAAHGA